MRPLTRIKTCVEFDAFGDTAPVHKSRLGGRICDATFGDFRCLACRYLVSAQPWLSRVRNRNHCPSCLWSRHLDLNRAGDRLSACKGGMRPIGLTMKRTRDKYRPERMGELMLIHQCEDCDRYSINRIAADDDPHQIINVFTASLHIGEQIRLDLLELGIVVLNSAQANLVNQRLFGMN